MSFNMQNKPFVFLDLETTGLNPSIHEVIEIGAIMVEGISLQPLSTFNMKVKPEHIETASDRALQINGYNKEAWQDAKSLQEVVEQFHQWVGSESNAVIVAQNVCFDYQFLKAAFDTYELPFPFDYHKLDVASMAWITLPNAESLSLSKIAKSIGLEEEPAIHRALYGAKLAYHVVYFLRFGEHAVSANVAA